MIPVKLKMRNFMCYQGDVPPLIFTGIHTACICGDNGNGKSALLDAMTWALWGKARAKSDDDLIHLSQAEMEVEFDFTAGGQLYRILRKRAKPRRGGSAGKSSLDLLISGGDGFKVISGNSMAQTQQKITADILHMDYDTFINSAFLRQGHADEFTLKGPADRKEVLANILGLAVYDELEERAKDLARQQETGKAQLESTVKDIDDELARKPAYETEFQTAQGELSRIEELAGEQESRVSGLRREKEALESKKVQLDQLEEHLAANERALERWEEQVRQHQAQLEEYEALIARRAAIDEGYAQFVATREQCDGLEQKFRQSVSLEKQRSQLDGRIREAGQGLITEHALAQSRITELEADYQKLPQLKGERQKAQMELSGLAEEEKTLATRREAGQELSTQVHQLASTRNQLEREIGELQEKLNLLATQTGARCPLCEQELEVASLKLIETKYTTDRDSKSDALRLNELELGRKRGELGSLEKEIAQMEVRLRQDLASAQGKVSLYSQQITEAEAAGDKLAEARRRLAEIEEQLARKEFALNEQRALAALEKELAELGYDPPQHEAVRQRLAGLEQYEEPKRRLEEADRHLGQEREAAASAEQAAQELGRSLEADREKRQGLNEELGRFSQLAGELARAEAEHQELVAQQKRAEEVMWLAKTKLERCSELEIRKGEKEKQLAQVWREEKIYKDLAQAFGKRGVQALLIEMALPEIESEADRLLGRMTDNRMHVKMEPLRPNKKGELVETLDINISDELGTRNYEMFSGGEAFRIDFAIRIALSKLLAKRAGAPLPTLVVDEGFGTQDSAGLEKLKEAINSIQDDFEKILVITHIDEFKDAFPTRIDVVKTAAGSTVEVS